MIAALDFQACGLVVLSMSLFLALYKLHSGVRAQIRATFSQKPSLHIPHKLEVTTLSSNPRLVPVFQHLKPVTGRVRAGSTSVFTELHPQALKSSWQVAGTRLILDE